MRSNFQMWFFPDHRRWFLANFAMSIGPLCAAIPLWHNSLVFHSVSKLTSFFLHGLPASICHIYR